MKKTLDDNERYWKDKHDAEIDAMLENTGDDDE
jgi:hypothetical protein